jgi:hypothetical protein
MHRRPDCEQHRQDAVDRVVRPRDDECQVAGANDARVAAHRRPDVRDADSLGLRRNPRGRLGRHRAEVDEDGSGLRGRDHLACDPNERLVVRERGEDEVADGREGGRRLGHVRAAVCKPGRLPGRAVVDDESVSGVDEAFRDRRPHVPEADQPNRHCAV